MFLTPGLHCDKGWMVFTGSAASAVPAWSNQMKSACRRSGQKAAQSPSLRAKGVIGRAEHVEAHRIVVIVERDDAVLNTCILGGFSMEQGAYDTQV